MKDSTAKKLIRTSQGIKRVDDFNKLYLFKTSSQKNIRVQPTSIARRRPGITKSGRRVPAGRPPTLHQSRGLKRKRNLCENVKENVPNAKSHGINH